MSYVQFLGYVMMTASIIGILFLIGYMIIGLAAPFLISILEAREAKKKLK